MTATSPLYVLTITSPAFILIALGYLSVKTGLLEKRGVQGLGWFITRIALPAAIFQALNSRSFQEILHFDYLLIYAGGSLIAFLLTFAIAKTIKRKTLTESAFFGLGSSMSNTMLIGYPIVIALFGPLALIPFALTLIVENLLILPLSLTLADTGQQQQKNFLIALTKSLGLLGKNPIVIAIVLGVICSAFSIGLPHVVDSVIGSLAATVSGLAQFTIGGILAGAVLSLANSSMNKDMSLILLGKLVLHPAAVLLLIFLLPPLEPMFSAVAILLACMPMFSIFAVLGMDYQLGEFCSATLLLTTLVSFLTINLAIWLLTTKYSLSAIG